MQGGNFIDTAHVYADWLPGPRSSSVTPQKMSITTAMTVVAIMIFRALPLDSWMPSKFWRKK